MNFHGFYISCWKLEPASQKSDLLVNRIEVIEEPDTQLTVKTVMMVLNLENILLFDIYNSLQYLTKFVTISKTFDYFSFSVYDI